MSTLRHLVDTQCLTGSAVLKIIEYLKTSRTPHLDLINYDVSNTISIPTLEDSNIWVEYVIHWGLHRPFKTFLSSLIFGSYSQVLTKTHI